MDNLGSGDVVSITNRLLISIIARYNPYELNQQEGNKQLNFLLFKNFLTFNKIAYQLDGFYFIVNIDSFFKSLSIGLSLAC